MYFTHDQIERARSITILQYLQMKGVKLIRKGSDYCTEEHDSLCIRGDNSDVFYWHSRDKGGKGVIDYMEIVEDSNFLGSVGMLLGYLHDPQLHSIPLTPVLEKTSEKGKGEFVLPEKNSNSNRVFAYLTKTRGLDREVLTELFKNGSIYESAQFHNAVFVGINSAGIPKYAPQRGTLTGKSYKRDCINSDKSYGFLLQGNPESKKVYVFESPIDALSFATLEKQAGHDWHEHSKLSLGGLSDKSLERFLKNNLQIRHIAFCTDADKPGSDAAELYMKKYKDLGYGVSRARPPEGKDFNETLCYRLAAQSNQSCISRN